MTKKILLSLKDILFEKIIEEANKKLMTPTQLCYELIRLGLNQQQTQLQPIQLQPIQLQPIQLQPIQIAQAEKFIKKYEDYIFPFDIENVYLKVDSLEDSEIEYLYEFMDEFIEENKTKTNPYPKHDYFNNWFNDLKDWEYKD